MCGEGPWRWAALEDCRLECLSLGNVLSTHVEGPAIAMLGDGSEAAAVAAYDHSEDEEDEEEEAEEARPFTCRPLYRLNLTSTVHPSNFI